MKVRIALFVVTVALAVFTSVAETAQSCIDPTTAYKTNSVPCSVLRSDSGTVLLGRNPTAVGLAYAFESRFFVSTASEPTAYDPLWMPGFLLFFW